MGARQVAVFALIAGAGGWLAATTAGAQAILHPNQIVGSIGWSNVNPTIRALIDAPSTYVWNIEADSLDAPSPLVATCGATSSLRQIDPYELTAEASPTGIAYRVSATVGRYSTDGYNFASIVAPALLMEPAPDLRLDMLECAGVLRIGTPVGVHIVDVRAWRDGEGAVDSDYNAQSYVFAWDPTSSVLVLVRGDGHLYHVRVRYTVGTDVQVDTLTVEQWFDVIPHCDEILDIDGTGGPGSGSGGGIGSGTLGDVRGIFDYVGEHEIPLPARWANDARSLVELQGGPWFNWRLHALDTDPASGPFLLPNLVPSTVVSPPEPYDTYVDAILRGGPDTQWVETPHVATLVGESEHVDVVDTFVIHPGWIDGLIDLAGPEPVGSFGSVLQHVVLAGSPTPGSLPPPSTLLPSLVIARGSAEVAPGAARSAVGASTVAAFPGVFDAVESRFAGTYEEVVGALGGDAGLWDAKQLALTFQQASTPAAPEDHVDCFTLIEDDGGSLLLVEPDARAIFDRIYCMSQVNVLFLTTSGTLCDPHVTISSGGLDGIDYLGRSVHYRAGADAAGTPVDVADATPTGRVVLGLPAGDYVIHPNFGAVNPTDGRVSRADVVPFPLTVGCREIINVFPEIGIDMSADAVPPCAEAGDIVVTGNVRSDEPVASITWSVDGGPATTVCTDCGVSPPYSARVQLDDGDNTVRLTATDVTGRTATVEAFTRWAPEPSALDRRPTSTPLTVSRDLAGVLTVAWEPGVGANLYRGTISSLHVRRTYDHGGVGACGIATGAFTFTDTPGSAYFLVNGSCIWGDGSLGRDSLGREHPPAVPRCN